MTPVLALHSAVTLLALGDAAGLRRLRAYAGGHRHATQREVVAPLVDAVIAALIPAQRYDEARALRDARLDRQVCRRDESWSASACTRGGRAWPTGAGPAP